jgi:hypothetical protein
MNASRKASPKIAAVTAQNPIASVPAKAAPASLIPKIPPKAATLASTTVTPVSRFMIRERLLLTVER